MTKKAVTDEENKANQNRTTESDDEKESRTENNSKLTEHKMLILTL